MAPHAIFRRSLSHGHPHRREYRHLTTEQMATWMHHGFVKVPHAFSRQAAADFTKDVWVRLGFDADDPRTWTREVTHMQSHNAVKVSTFAPGAWGAICDLLGGEERVEGGEEGAWWDDGFIVNLGSEDTEGKEGNVVEEVDGWHVDGDFFVHFLDSPEQGLLVVPLWADVIENGGGTVVCCDGIGKVARWLYEHPEGVSEGLIPLHQGAEDRWYCEEFVAQCDDFFELTGEAGDVYILHPLMIHSAAKNGLRIPRIVTNPNVMLKEPFQFDRRDPTQYSLVELKTMKELGSKRLEGWRITGERRPLEPGREDNERQLQEEKDRLEAARLASEYAGSYVELSERPPPIPPRTYLPVYGREYYG